MISAAQRARVVGAARGALGTPAKAQGRLDKVALDCVGLVAHSYASAGFDFDVPRDYSLRADNRQHIGDVLSSFGFAATKAGRPGDVVEAAVGGAQHHLGILTDRGIVHAHFGMRRVVEHSLPAQWRIANIWIWEGDCQWRPCC